MLKKWVRLLGLARYMIQRESRRKNDLVEATSVPLELSLLPKDACVRVVLAGGLVEMYRDPILASSLMEKYPGMCVTRPEVFKRPHESLVRPDEKLQPGQKFYLLPCTTFQKLKRKYPEKAIVIVRDESKALVSCERKMLNGDFEESLCSRSAKDFYVSRDEWAKCVIRRWREGGEEKRPFTPPIKKERTWRRLGWQPSLTSIEELSP